MLYGCNCASVGVPEEASNRSTAVTPGSASIWPCSVPGGPPISEYAISTWNEPGVQLGDAVGVAVAGAVGVAVAGAVGVGVGVEVVVGVALGDAVAVGVGVPQGVRI